MSFAYIRMSQHVIISCLIFFIVCIYMFHTLASAEIINPSFEDGVLTPWVGHVSYSGEVSIQNNSAFAYDGSYYAKVRVLDTTSQHSDIYQSGVDLTGVDEVTFMLWCSYAGASIYAWVDGTSIPLTSPAQSAWVEMSFDVSGYSGNHTIKYQISNGAGQGYKTTYVDAFKLDGVGWVDPNSTSTIVFNPDVDEHNIFPNGADYFIGSDDVNEDNYIYITEWINYNDGDPDNDYWVDNFLGYVEGNGTVYFDDRLFQLEYPNYTEVVLFSSGDLPVWPVPRPAIPPYQSGGSLDYDTMVINWTPYHPVPEPTPDLTPLPTPEYTPVPTPTPDPGGNDSINSSFMEGYYDSIDDLVGSVNSTSGGIIEFLTSPINYTNEYVNTLNNTLNSTLSNVNNSRGVLLGITIPLFIYLPSKIINVGSYYLTCHLILLLLKE